jgi:hypothetical protein
MFPLAVLCQLFWLTCIVVVAALFPNYLVDYLHLGMDQMGFILSSLGFGGAIGALTLPALSDRIGRKPVMLISAAGAFASFWFFLHAGAQPGILFVCLFIAMGCLYSLLTLTVGPITAEAVPAKLMATGTGMVIRDRRDLRRRPGAGIGRIHCQEFRDSARCDHAALGPRDRRGRDPVAEGNGHLRGSVDPHSRESSRRARGIAPARAVAWRIGRHRRGRTRRAPGTATNGLVPLLLVKRCSTK